MAATKNNMLGEEMSPFLTTIEPEVVEWCACQFGLGSGAGSTLLAGGSLAIPEGLTIISSAFVHEVKSETVSHGIFSVTSLAKHRSG
jgi:glutamate/tyrosine decarboxylase-like PLP-dependent enzyme